MAASVVRGSGPTHQRGKSGTFLRGGVSSIQSVDIVDRAFSVVPAHDGGFILAGITYSFGGARDDRIINGQETPDGGYALAGFTMSTDATGLDVYLTKLDPLGNVAWTRTIGGRGEDSGYGIACTLDGGIIVTGLTKSSGAGEADLYLVKTDWQGVR